jgi:small subunit ribosomal protein S3Ae
VGKKLASDSLKGRVFEISLGDLKSSAEEQEFRKMRLVVEEVQGKNALCNFHGMTFTRDKLCSLVRKWTTLIEASADVKTTDGYVVRLFCIGFTKKAPNQVRKTSYAQSSQIRNIRKRMVETMYSEASKLDIKTLFERLMVETIGKEIQKKAEAIYPLRDTFIRKVKILKRPKFDLNRLMELHGDSGEDTGKALAQSQIQEGTIETLEGAGGRL